jgi:cytochrome bd-type quinol oxidase subunit 1
MKRNVPLAIALIVGLVMISTSYFPTTEDLYQLMRQWMPIITAFAFFLGIVSYLLHHTTKIKRKVRDYPFSMASLLAFFVMVAAGLLNRWWPSLLGSLDGKPHESLFNWLYMNMLVPMESTMFALLAFYIASSAFRAFRARNFEATLLLTAAVLVMIGRVPIGEWTWEGLSEIQQWIMEFPNTAAKRAIWIGVGLGMASTALKLILGVERAYLGKGD